MSAMADEYVQVPYTPFQHPQEAHEELRDLPDDTLDPLKIFSYFWDDDLLATICFATNQYALRYYNMHPSIPPHANHIVYA